MKAVDITDQLPSVHIARMMYSYGKLDEMIGMGFDSPDEDFYCMFYELLSLTADAIWNDYDESYDVGKWYFSNRSMVEYYRLCRIYGRAHKLKRKDNPYMRDAERYVEGVMDLGCCGYGWRLNTGVKHEWASGIVFRTDCYFNGEYELLEALLCIQEWFTRAVIRLRGKLMEERVIRVPTLPAPAEKKDCTSTMLPAIQERTSTEAMEVMAV